MMPMLPLSSDEISSTVPDIKILKSSSERSKKRAMVNLLGKPESTMLWSLRVRLSARHASSGKADEGFIWGLVENKAALRNRKWASAYLDRESTCAHQASLRWTRSSAYAYVESPMLLSHGMA